ncbi:MAG: hypothetical protein CME25_08080 [Gemmatimonadetes bacterium]|nr:hypothetical protein [Gemmatimonadota bacterium]
MSIILAGPNRGRAEESFNGRSRVKCLSEHGFTSLADVRKTLNLWRTDYNTLRPHTSLNDHTPWEFLSQHSRSTRNSLIAPGPKTGAGQSSTLKLPGPNHNEIVVPPSLQDLGMRHMTV